MAKSVHSVRLRMWLDYLVQLTGPRPMGEGALAWFAAQCSEAVPTRTLAVERDCARLLVVWLILVTLTPGYGLSAEDRTAGPMEATAAESSERPGRGIWVDGIGSGYQRGVWTWGIGLSRSFGQPIFGSSERQDLWMGNLQLGVIVDRPWLEGTFLRGNFELSGMLSGGIQHNEEQAYLVTLAPGMRYHFATGTRFVPFVTGSAGVGVTDMEDPDLNGTFQFDLRFGVGLRCYVTPKTCLTVEYGVLHLSNGGTSASAHGINTQMITLGLSHQI